jgi:hypothetical protein
MPSVRQDKLLDFRSALPLYALAGKLPSALYIQCLPSSCTHEEGVRGGRRGEGEMKGWRLQEKVEWMNGRGMGRGGKRIEAGIHTGRGKVSMMCVVEEPSAIFSSKTHHCYGLIPGLCTLT